MNMPRALWWSWGGGLFLMSEVPLQYDPAVQRFSLLNTKTEREFFIDNLLVRIHFIIVMISWTGLAPWDFQFSFPDRLTFTFLAQHEDIHLFRQRRRPLLSLLGALHALVSLGLGSQT